MLQLFISWRLTDADLNVFKKCCSLNDEWTAACFWQRADCVIANSIPPSVEFRHCSGTSEDIFISGTLRIGETLTVRRCRGGSNGQMRNYQTFSKFMESGSSSLIVNVKLPLHKYPNYYLQCTVNISSIFEKFATILDDRECKKCGNLKSLVELSNELEILLDPGTSCFSDVTLICDDASIPAHKNILSARSAVFAAMFKNPMKENRDSEVVIEDIDASTLRTMLAFMYTGKASNLTIDSVCPLLLAADKYLLLDLKRVCCDYLKGNTSVENVLRILVLGELHSKDLKLCTIDYICKNFKNISNLKESAEWRILKKERPSLIIDVLESIVKSREVTL